MPRGPPDRPPAPYPGRMTPASPHDDDGAPAVRRRVLVLLNPRAGRRRGLVRAEARLRERPGLAVDLVVPDPADHAAQLAAARAALAEGVDAVVVRGGDGMVGAGFGLVCDHAAATGRRVPLGIVPAGTGNDVARAAGLHRHDPRAALETVLRALEAPTVRTRDVDALRVTVTRPATAADGEADGADVVVQRRWAANSVNIGFDARVNARANRLRRLPGPLRYLAALALEARAFVPQELGLRLDDGPPARRRAALVTVQNGPSIGGGIPLAPGARIDDGRADAVIVGPLPTAGLVALFPLVYVRGHRLVGALRTARVRRIAVRVPAGMPVYADGDPVVEEPVEGCEVTVEAVPGAVALLG